MKICPKCGSKSFCVTAHVTQDWVVDENGNFICSSNDCVEVTHFPDDSDVWDCNNCGYSAEGSAFNIKDFLIGTSWNPVLNVVKNLKQKFIDIYGAAKLYNYENYGNCIMYWAEKLSEYQDIVDDYKKIFEPLVIKQFDKMVLIKYDLLNTFPGFWDAYHGFYRECRSVVIDVENEELVLTPFKKFFNLNEIEETQEFIIRDMIKTALKVEISDKMDGSMISARYYNGKIVLSSSGSLSPDSSMHCKLGYELLTDAHKNLIRSAPDYTFIFELISPKDAHVVAYAREQEGLYLIGIRSTDYGIEAEYDNVIHTAEKYNIPHTIVFNKTFDQLLNSLDDKKSNEAEGFVLNIDNYKLKLKYNDYVTIHKMLSKLVSTNAIIKAVDEGKWDDIKSKLPEAYRIDAESIVDDILLYTKGMNELVQLAYKDVRSNCAESKNHDALQDKKNFVTYAFEHYKNIAHYLISIYEDQPINFIRSKNGKYMKYYEIVKEIERRGFK